MSGASTSMGVPEQSYEFTLETTVLLIGDIPIRE